MTQKVFRSAPYQTELDIVVTHVDGDRVQIERTIFSAFSGGQESDSGRRVATLHDVLYRAVATRLGAADARQCSCRVME